MQNVQQEKKIQNLGRQFTSGLQCSENCHGVWCLQVMELVKMKKPLASLDFCYSGECENISVQVFPPKFIPRFSRQYLNILPAYSYFIFFSLHISTLRTFS
jgi:hypothetical protein